MENSYLMTVLLFSRKPRPLFWLQTSRDFHSSIHDFKVPWFGERCSLEILSKKAAAGGLKLFRPQSTSRYGRTTRAKSSQPRRHMESQSKVLLPSRRYLLVTPWYVFNNFAGNGSIRAWSCEKVGRFEARAFREARLQSLESNITWHFKST